MKVDINQLPEFTPITLELTFETLEELQEFYALFNYTLIHESLDVIDAAYIRDVLYTKTSSAYSESALKRLYKNIIYNINTLI